MGGIFQWHVGCCPCVAESGCKHRFNPDGGDVLEDHFDITGGPYGVISSASTDQVWVSGDTSFIYKTTMPYNEQNMACDAIWGVKGGVDSEITIRLVCDYQDDDNYHFFQYASSGDFVFGGGHDWNTKLGKRQGGVDTILESSLNPVDTGGLCDGGIGLSSSSSRKISVCTGDNAMYGSFINRGGLHSPIVPHSGGKVGLILSMEGDGAYINFYNFTTYNHNEWGNDITQAPPESDVKECLDCGRCACSGESPASYRVYINNLKKGGTPDGALDGYDCCTGYNGTHIVEQWGNEVNSSEYSAYYEEDVLGTNKQLCYYFNKFDPDPCNSYGDAYIWLKTSVEGSGLNTTCQIYRCFQFQANDSVANWQKSYGKSTETGIPCTQFDYEPIPFIYGGRNGLINDYYKFWPCSGDATSCQVTAL